MPRRKETDEGEGEDLMADQKISFPEEWFEFSIYKEIIWQDEFDQMFNPQTPLMYEAAYFHGLKTLMPWEMADYTVPVVIKEWKTVKVELHEKFSKRKLIEVEQPMKKGIGLFIEVLYWCNGYPGLSLNKDDDKLRIKPVNLQERLHFIISYPNKYHSYIQLIELFSEMEKLFSVQQVIKKAKTP
jgi:hypothetical protein